MGTFGENGIHGKELTHTPIFSRDILLHIFEIFNFYDNFQSNLTLVTSIGLTTLSYINRNQFVGCATDIITGHV